MQRAPMKKVFLPSHSLLYFIYLDGKNVDIRFPPNTRFSFAFTLVLIHMHTMNMYVQGIFDFA